MTQGALAAHRLSGGRKKMSAPGELWILVSNQPEPGFMHQSRMHPAALLNGRHFAELLLYLAK
jgi:hypothetical protein